MGSRKAGDKQERTIARSHLALLAAAITGILIAVAPGPASSQGTGDAGSPQARVSPPEPWRSYPLNQVRQNLAAQAEQDACDFVAHQKGPRRALLIFLVGRASRQNGKFGVGPDDNFRPHNRVYTALEAAANAYASCRALPSQQVDIAYGVTNYELSQEIATQKGVSDWAEAQRRVVNKLTKKAPKGVGAAMAGDIEPGWDPNGSGMALSLIHGSAEGSEDVYNFGSVGIVHAVRTGLPGKLVLRGHRPGRAGLGDHRPAADLLPKAGKDLGPRPRTAGTSTGTTALAPRSATASSSAGSRPTSRGAPVSSTRRGRAGFACAVPPAGRWAGASSTSTRGGWRAALTPRSRPPRRLSRAAGPLPLMPVEVPAEIVEDPEPVVSSDIMATLENAWRVGSHTEYTWVFAGSAGWDPQTGEPVPDGRIIITRETYRRDGPTTPTMETVDVPGSGPLRVTQAPLGRRVTEDAHQSASVHFEGASGVTGTLDLGDSSVELDAP